jgi:hypothetical protein
MSVVLQRNLLGVLKRSYVNGFNFSYRPICLDEVPLQFCKEVQTSNLRQSRIS